MLKKFVLPFMFLILVLQVSCSLHSGSTYNRGEMGQPQSFSKGVIISERNVKVKGTESGVGVVSGAVLGGLGGSMASDDKVISAIGAIGGAIAGGNGWCESGGTNYEGQRFRIYYSTGCWRALYLDPGQ